MKFSITPSQIVGFPASEYDRFQKLINVFTSKISKNAEKNKYYEGKITLGEVNLGIALPDGMSKLEIGCAWGAKTVDVLAARSMFDGFVGLDGKEVETLNKIAINNNLIAEYAKCCRDELKFGCTFATLAKDKKNGAKIRFHSPQTAAALWNGEKGRIDCGFAIIDTASANEQNTEDIASVVYYYTDTSIWELRFINYSWSAIEHRHNMGRPLMEPFIWNATSNKPFGRSRIKEPIRRLIDGYIRTIANATIGLEFATTPQKYLMGVSDDQYDAVVSQKFKQYVGSIIAGTMNAEGEKPEFGQLPQGSITPHVEMVRVLATQFSAATGLSVTDTGVVNEANPTSSDAILAQSQTLIGMAEQLNKGNGDSLRMIALMALAIAKDTTIDQLSEDEKAIMAHFKNPAMPNVAVTADAALKIASGREGFASTDVYLEMIGFDKADIRRIKSQEGRTRGEQLITEIENANIE